MADPVPLVAPRDGLGVSVHALASKDMQRAGNHLEVELVLEDGVPLGGGAPGLPVRPVPDVRVRDHVRDVLEMLLVDVEEGRAAKVPVFFLWTPLF